MPPTKIPIIYITLKILGYRFLVDCQWIWSCVCFIALFFFLQIVLPYIGIQEFGAHTNSYTNTHTLSLSLCIVSAIELKSTYCISNAMSLSLCTASLCYLHIVFMYTFLCRGNAKTESSTTFRNLIGLVEYENTCNWYCLYAWKSILRLIWPNKC